MRRSSCRLNRRLKKDSAFWNTLFRHTAREKEPPTPLCALHPIRVEFAWIRAHRFSYVGENQTVKILIGVPFASRIENNIRLKVIGNSRKLPKLVLKEIFQVEKETAHNDGMVLNIALSYGGREEIVQAAQKMIKEGKTKISEKTFSQYLYTRGQPDPDLLIRSSGEMRISNFLLWQCAYAEFYFTDTLWPDFNEEEFYKALQVFQLRKRRYGRTH